MEFFFIIYGVLATHWISSYMPDGVSEKRRVLFAGVLASLLSFLALVFMADRGLITDIPIFRLLGASVLGSLWGIMLAFLLGTYLELINQSKEVKQTFVFTILSPFQNSMLTYTVAALFLIVTVIEIPWLNWFPLGHEDTGRIVLIGLMGVFFLFFSLKKMWARTFVMLTLTLLLYDGLMSFCTGDYQCPMTLAAIILRSLGILVLLIPFFMPLHRGLATPVLSLVVLLLAYPAYLRVAPGNRCDPLRPLSHSEADRPTLEMGAENRYKMELPSNYGFIEKKGFPAMLATVPEEADLFFRNDSGTIFGFTEVYEVDPVADAPMMKETIAGMYEQLRKTYWVDFERLRMLKDSYDRYGFDLHFNYQRSDGSHGGFVHTFRYGHFLALSVSIYVKGQITPELHQEIEGLLLGIHLIKDPVNPEKDEGK